MIRVFISYCNESDGKTANALFDYLDQEQKIKPILSPKNREINIENGEKIANEIDSCNFFITFYTKNGKGNEWVNQELGYAFNHVRQDGLRIIPIYNDRNDFGGFLTSKSYNFYKGFCLNEEEPEKTMEAIKNYLTEEFSHPIELEFKIGESTLVPSKTYHTFKAIISIYNSSPKKIQDAILDFVLPNQFGEILNLEGDFKQDYRFIKSKYKSEILPRFHTNKIKFDIFKRLNILLEDVLGLNAYEIPFEFQLSTNLTRILFGIYITIPLFGTKYYQGILEHNESNWELSDFHCLDDYSDEIINVRLNLNNDFE